MPVRLLQLALLIAAAGALLLLVGIGGDAAVLAGLGAMAFGTVLSAPATRGSEAGWWSMLAAGVAVAGAGEALSLLTETVGGLVSVLGGLAVLIAVMVRLPLE